MKETDYLNFKSTDMLTIYELKSFYSKDALYKSSIITSRLLKYFYFNQQSQMYHRISDNMPLDIKNMDEYISTISRKLLLESMTYNKMVRRSVFEKQIEYFLDLVPDIKMRLIVNNPLHNSNYNDSDDSEDEFEFEFDTKNVEAHYSLSYIKARLEIAQYDTKSVQEILQSLQI